MSNSFATPWTTAHRAPLSMESPRQEYWSGVSSPSPGTFPIQGSNLHLLHWEDSLPLSHLVGTSIFPSVLINFLNTAFNLEVKQVSAEPKITVVCFVLFCFLQEVSFHPAFKFSWWSETPWCWSEKNTSFSLFLNPWCPHIPLLLTTPLKQWVLSTLFTERWHPKQLHTVGTQ